MRNLVFFDDTVSKSLKILDQDINEAVAADVNGLSNC